MLCSLIAVYEALNFNPFTKMMTVEMQKNIPACLLVSQEVQYLDPIKEQEKIRN